MKMYRELGMTQKSAWFLAHRIRESFNNNPDLLEGPMELDEEYFRGREKNKHNPKKLRAGRGTVSKAAVAGARDQETGQISAAVVPSTDKATLDERVASEAEVFTDDHGGYEGMGNRLTVKRSIGEYVNDQAHINGVESFWAMMKRG